MSDRRKIRIENIKQGELTKTEASVLLSMRKCEHNVRTATQRQVLTQGAIKAAIQMLKSAGLVKVTYHRRGKHEMNRYTATTEGIRILDSIREKKKVDRWYTEQDERRRPKAHGE